MENKSDRGAGAGGGGWLSSKQEALTLDSQHPLNKWQDSCSSSAGEVKTEGFLELTHQPGQLNWLVSGSVRDPVSKHQIESGDMAQQLEALTLKTWRPEFGALKTFVTWVSRGSGDRKLTEAYDFQLC